MLVEYSFISSDNNKCHIALCDEPRDKIDDVVSKYWQSHGIDDGSWAKFEFHRNKDNEYVCLTACNEICGCALEFLLSSLESSVGQRCTVPDLLRIVREFDKDMRERYE